MALICLNNAIRLLTCCLFLFLTQSAFSKTFFSSDEKKSFGYYNTETIRSEKIEQLETDQNYHYSTQHKRIANHLVNHEYSIATEAKWTTSKTLRIGVIRRSLADEDYAISACKIIRTYGLEDEGISIKIIYLPSLLVYQRLELLIEQKCI